MVFSKQSGRCLQNCQSRVFDTYFSDVDAQKIRFLEILTYSQLLKRIRLEDPDIERVIGALFGCNYVLFQEKHH